MGKKRIPVDKKQFEALKNELERVSGIDLFRQRVLRFM
jgi:hypothetical protein